MTYVSRNIMAELTKGEKLNGENYKIWAMKIQCVLKEQEILTVLDHILTEPEKYITLKHISVSVAFESWKKKFIACIMLLGGMKNDVMRELGNMRLSKKCGLLWSTSSVEFLLPNWHNSPSSLILIRNVLITVCVSISKRCQIWLVSWKMLAIFWLITDRFRQ
jgi:hypothetical protein